MWTIFEVNQVKMNEPQSHNRFSFYFPRFHYFLGTQQLQPSATCTRLFDRLARPGSYNTQDSKIVTGGEVLYLY